MENNRTTEIDQVPGPFAEVGELLLQLESNSRAKEQVAATLLDVADAALSASRPVAARAASVLASLVEILVVADESAQDQVSAVADFIRSGTQLLDDALIDPESDGALEGLVGEAETRWGEWLDLAGQSDSIDPWETNAPVDTADEDGSDAPSAEELSAFLESLGTGSGKAEGDEAVAVEAETEPVSPSTRSGQAANPEPLGARGSSHSPLDPGHGPALEGELLEAYLDDAGRCLSSIEVCVLAYEQAPSDKQPLQQICRELHTLKGASASVGLQSLAEYLHQLEDQIESSDGQVDAEQLLPVVDSVREQIAGLQPTKQPISTAPLDSAPGDHSAEETLRVKASQLDRLMDMLAELVMLRNGREARLNELRSMNDELLRCGTRLRTEGEEHVAAGGRTSKTNPLREMADDVIEIARGQRDVFEAASEENLAVSRFIRNFRQELAEARRLPISGLFRRLQRAVHDAAKAEAKHVRLVLRGEHAGLERSLQERLYEPLLHIVRNSVSHGIETAEERSLAAKASEGTIELEARGAPNLLQLEVRDDGRGLNYDAIRKRGIERGILPADQPVSQQELAQLIFHPGFSTRDEATAISGRGVGMDVVADTLSRMGAWVDVDSQPGLGTRIRLSIPLRSVIEHTMVFRSQGRLFAIPMQHVTSVGARGEDTETTVSLGAVFGGQPDEAGGGQQVTIRSGPTVDGGSGNVSSSASLPLTLLVDELVGPEEVVIRPLPHLLRFQSLVSGVSLSGSGELLLLLDCTQLASLSRRSEFGGTAEAARPAPSRNAPKGAVLVVDDSISARRCLSRAIHHFGLETCEASDGREALDLLRQGGISAVFSDLEMPRVGGFELLREVGTAPPLSQVPVAIVSSRSETEYQTQAGQLGAVAYITKPVTESRVGEVLRQMGALSA